MKDKELHPYLRERLEKEENFLTAKKKPEEKKRLEQILKKDKQLKEAICEEVYPEWKVLFVEEGKNPTYFRADVSERKADAYTDRGDNPLLVFLRPTDMEKEENFIDYFGINLESFIKKVKDGKIIPQIGQPTDYPDSDFCRNFLDHWLDDEKLYKERALVSANRLQDLLGGKTSAKEWKEVYGDKFKAVEGEYVKVPALKDREASEYFAERYGFFKLGWEDGARILDELMEYYKRGEEDLQRIAYFAFSGHQLRTSHPFYSKGSTVTVSKGDLEVALDNFEEVVRIFGSEFSPELVILWNWIYSLKEGIKRSPPILPIARIKSLRDRLKYYGMREKDDRVQKAVKEATNIDNKIIDITRNKEAFERLEEMKGLIEELARVAEEIRLAAKSLKFVDRVVDELASTAILNGAEFLLKLPPLLPEVEKHPKEILKNLVRSGREFAYKLFPENFMVPMSAWKEGEIWGEDYVHWR